MRFNWFVLYLLVAMPLLGQSPLNWKGQVSAWTNINDSRDWPVWLGARFLPQINGAYKTGKDSRFHFEASANINGSVGCHPFDSVNHDGVLKAYRFWMSFSTLRFEIRAGLQKINFGSATNLRPLMWFDRVDPRDPLQMTDGVWGLLSRYYFQNNANIWFWVLYGNNDPKTWELGVSTRQYPEWGGRLQYPAGKGELAMTYHHRVVDSRNLESLHPVFGNIAEDRLGMDGKWDLGPGLWFEAVWLRKQHNIGVLTHQHMLTLGADNTFPMGQGLNIVLEHLLFWYNEKAFRFDENVSFSSLSLSYPLNMNDQIAALIYYDWTHNGSYNIITWRRYFNRVSMYAMFYANPNSYQVPFNNSETSLFAGKGFQIMAVWNF